MVSSTIIAKIIRNVFVMGIEFDHRSRNQPIKLRNGLTIYINVKIPRISRNQGLVNKHLSFFKINSYN